MSDSDHLNSIKITMFCSLSLHRSSRAWCDPGCEEPVEQPLPHGGEIRGAVSCPPSSLHGSSLEKINGEGQVYISGQGGHFTNIVCPT